MLRLTALKSTPTTVRFPVDVQSLKMTYPKSDSRPTKPTNPPMPHVYPMILVAGVFVTMSPLFSHESNMHAGFGGFVCSGLATTYATIPPDFIALPLFEE